MKLATTGLEETAANFQCHSVQRQQGWGEAEKCGGKVLDIYKFSLSISIAYSTM